MEDTLVIAIIDFHSLYWLIFDRFKQIFTIRVNQLYLESL